MNISKTLYDALKNSFEKLGFDANDITLTFSNRAEADYQCNSVFAIAKKMHMNPDEVANKIIESLEQDIAEVTFARPGFINFKLKNEVLSSYLNEALADERMCLSKLDNPIKVPTNIETIVQVLYICTP